MQSDLVSFRAFLWIIGGGAFFYFQLRIQYNRLYQQHERLRKAYEELRKQPGSSVPVRKTGAVPTASKSYHSWEVEHLQWKTQRAAEQYRPELFRQRPGIEGEFFAERKAAMKEIQAILNSRQMQPKGDKAELIYRHPVPGLENIDFVERACAALGATSTTGNHVHIADICLHALKKGGWTPIPTTASLAVDKVFQEVRSFKYRDRISVSNHMVMLRGDQARFPDQDVVLEA